MSEKTLQELTQIAEKLEKLEIEARKNNVRLARLCDQAYAKECRDTVVFYFFCISHLNIL
jgi:hypothetical protein